MTAVRQGRAPTDEFDVIVIGGGINGAASARDAAMRGLRVLLVEKDDISHAASAWNSRMIHGGIKYLETYELDLVRESLREREWLIRSAPHLVRPLPFLMPFLRRGRRPPWLLRLGMIGYDVLSIDKSLPRHRILGRDDVLRIAPGLVPEEVRGGALFFDAQVEYAERLGVEAVISASEHGARVMTHTRATRVLLQGRRVVGVGLLDLITGESSTARAAAVVNATGAWVDELLLDLPGHVRPLVGGTKGTHLVVDPFPGAPSEALYYEAVADGRPVLVIPWLGRYLIGATDVRVDGQLDRVGADHAEIDYILSETNQLIPEAMLTPGDVRFAYTGVRPLPYSPDREVARITRHHVVHDHAPDIEGLVSLVGGKLTTFRAFGQDAIDVVMRRLGRKGKSRSKAERLPGGRTNDLEAFTTSLHASSGLDRSVVERLVRVYGVRAEVIATMARSDRSLGRMVDEEHGLLAAEVAFATRHEFARTLTDVMMRRTMLGLEPEHGPAIVEAVASTMRELEGWSSDRERDELSGYLATAARHRPFVGADVPAPAPAASLLIRSGDRP